MKREFRSQKTEVRMGIGLIGVLMMCASVQAATVMCDSNGVVYHPTNFWVVSGAEEMMMDIAEATVDTEVGALLSDYYTAAQSDARYKQYGSGDYAHNVLVDRTNLSLIAGFDVQTCLDSIEQILTNLVAGGSTVVTNGTNTIIISSGSTNAADIRVAFTPAKYTPATNSVESHLIAIDSKLGYLLALVTNAAPPATNIYLTGLTLTGNNLVYEGSTNRYYITAAYSDGTTRDVSGDGVWSVANGPATASMIGTNLVVGAITWNTSVTVKAEYSWNGSSLSRSTAVQINDTNVPTLQRVGVIGSASVNERTTNTYSAWAIYDQGVSNNVTTASSWGFGTAVPSGTTITNGSLIAGAVTTNTSITLAVTYSTVSSNKPVTIANVDQHLLFTFNYSGAYSAGTLHLEGYNNRMMSGFPVWKTSIPYTGPYGSWSTNILSTAIRQTGTGQFSGQTWWWAWIDTDGNGVINGAFVPASSPFVTMRNNEPGAIAYGQTATTGPALSNNYSTAIRFDLTDQRWGYARQGWTTAQMIGPAYVVAINSVGGSRVGYYAFTNRTFICDQDMLTSSYGPITINAGMAVYVMSPGLYPHQLWGGFAHTYE